MRTEDAMVFYTTRYVTPVCGAVVSEHVSEH